MQIKSRLHHAMGFTDEDTNLLIVKTYAYESKIVEPSVRMALPGVGVAMLCWAATWRHPLLLFLDHFNP